MTRLSRSFLLVLAVLALPGAACRSANPVGTALTATPDNRPETVAYALASSYVTVAEQALKIAQDSMTPPAVKHALKVAHENASPWVKRLRPGAARVNELRAAVAAGTSTPEKLAAAIKTLNDIITQAAPKIDSVATAVNGGTP